jgi:L-amino acid N-acyltransferase YncA
MKWPRSEAAFEVLLMDIRSARETDAAEIASIFNHEVEHSAPIWVETFVTVDDRRKWITARQTDGFPVLIAEDGGQVLGFGSFGPFRPYEGFRQTVEHLVYVSAAARGKGVGRALLAALVDLARDQGKKVIVGAVDSENESSLTLHRAMGFVETGRMPQIGEKWGKRRTMVLLQKELMD